VLHAPFEALALAQHGQSARHLGHARVGRVVRAHGWFIFHQCSACGWFIFHQCSTRGWFIFYFSPMEQTPQQVSRHALRDEPAHHKEFGRQHCAQARVEHLVLAVDGARGQGGGEGLEFFVVVQVGDNVRDPVVVHFDGLQKNNRNKEREFFCFNSARESEIMALKRWRVEPRTYKSTMRIEIHIDWCHVDAMREIGGGTESQSL
jgi:hypothetical protein